MTRRPARSEWRLGLASIFLAASFPALPAVNLEAGEWRVGMVVEIPGGRGPNPGKLEREMCLDPSDVAKIVAPPNAAACRVFDMRESPDEISFAIACSQGPMRTRGKAKIEFSGDRFKGLVETRADPPYDMHITQHIAGKRLGECKFPRKPAPDLKPYGGG
jgi:hypothetical protein